MFERAFKEFGLPRAIRTDNGVPFAGPNGLFNLSRLAVWWLRLGIGIERIKSGNPQQNGRHERMHLTLKLETTKPAGDNFDDFVEEFETERPHQGLGMACPAERYDASPRPYRGLPDLDYPFHDQTVIVTTCNRICYKRTKINLSHVFAGQAVGIKPVKDRIWLASFMDYDLGYDDETCRLEPLPNPFGPKVVTYVSGIKRNLCVQNGPKNSGWGAWIRTRDDGTKNRCLTAWRRPNVMAAITCRSTNAACSSKASFNGQSCSCGFR
ncbi:hypothetical protein PMI07_001442 [Rhizobium sp. CF080]|nr:hypothetical protein PMI07_001442 [Rhizobium sp. CF080]